MSLILMSCIVLSFLSCEVKTQSRTFSRCFYTEPECPNPNVTFYLYTRDTQEKPTQLDVANPETIFNAKYNKNRPLIVLMHGYTGDKDYSPNKQIRPAYFKIADFNIISVDYKEIAAEPCYHWSVANIPIVANCTAQLLDFLVDENIFKLKSIHLIGFSLGAQGAGMVANYLKPGRKLKRITGLDPAKPLFVRAGIDGRIDENDADFVDIIHTDVFGRGILSPSGHVDFYVNGGFNQPGCHKQLQMSPGSCNHERAAEYYAESIYSNLGFWGFRCAHWYLYALGFCKEEDSDSIAEMGFYADKESRGLYFLTTEKTPPYARGKNFTTNTVLPESEIAEDDNENFENSF